MKKILFLFAICTVCGCERPQVKDKQAVNQTVSKTGFGEGVREVEIKGHIFLIFEGVNKGNIIHAEHCPCKTTK